MTGRGPLAIVAAALALTPAVALAAPSDLDPTFGLGGRVTIASPNLSLNKFAVDPAGRIVVVGESGDSGWVARFLPNGQLDPSFNGTGQTTVQVAQTTGGQTFLEAVAIQPNGQIVLGGDRKESDDTDHPVVFRLNADGSRDTTRFGADDGVRSPPVGGTVAAQTQALAIAPGGRIVAAGYSVDAMGSWSDFEVVFTPDGKYAAGPVGSGDFLNPHAIVVQPSGKLVFVGGTAGGTRGYQVYLHRTDADLNDDPSFGDPATPSTTLIQLGQGGAPPISNAFDAIPGGTGIVVAGQATDSGGVPNMLVTRFTPDGALDTTFGSGGSVLLRAGATGSGPRSYVASLALDSAGRIVLVGASSQADGKLQQTAARLTAGGTPDTSFAPGGFRTYPFGTGSDLQGVALQPDGKILAGSDGYFAGGNDFGGVVRLIGGDQASGPPPGGGSTDHFAGASLLRRQVTVSGRLALVRHRCPASAPGFCAISDAMASKTLARHSSASARAKKPVKIGSGRATLKPGRSGVVKVKLSAKALKALAHGHKLVAQLTTTSSDGVGTRKTSHATVTLRRGKHGR